MPPKRFTMQRSINSDEVSAGVKPDTGIVQESESPRVRVGGVRSTFPCKVKDDFCFGSLADLSQPIPDVRFTPESRHAERRNQCPLSAKSGHFAASQGFEFCC